jgi:uncharacterized membrane protein YeiH
VSEWLEALGEFFRADGDFELPTYFTMLAYLTFGATGALAGMRRGFDIVGVFFLAIITAGGGGVIRDAALISSEPSNILTDGRYVVLVLVATILAMVFHRLVDRLNRTIAVIDALGLGAFTVHGIQVCTEAGLDIPAAIMGGTITAVGGGLLRDVLVGDVPLLFKPGQFYALVAMGGSGLFVALAKWEACGPNRAAWITIATVFVFRMLAIRFNWQTSALYREPPPRPPETPAGSESASASASPPPQAPTGSQGASVSET